MKLPRAAKFGLVVTAVGVLIFLGVAIWMKTARTTVADFPVPMHPGTISQDFTVDYDAIYTMSVQVDRNIPATTASCLLGGHKPEVDMAMACKNTPALLKFSWELSRDGQAGGTGTSAEMGNSSFTDKTLDITIVSFPARKNHKYTAELKFDQDASTLKLLPPRVRIDLDIFNREDFIFAGAGFDSVGLALCLVGGTMFLVSFLRARSRAKNAVTTSP